MPELPEVETMRRGVAPIIGGKVVSAVRTACSRKPIAITPRIEEIHQRLVGQAFVDVGRIGKRVIAQLNDNQRLVFEPRMTGLVLLADPPTTEHLRFVLVFRQKKRTKRLMYWDRRGLGNIRLFHEEEFHEYFKHRLGPDALQATGDFLKQQLGHSQREVKVALLDQKAIAGVGNLYASELLFEAGVDPRTRCNRLSQKQWGRIADAMVRILNEAITYEGSTLSDGTYRNALNKKGGYQNHHRVYDRQGEMCPNCRERKIIRIVQCQRSTFYCRKCQKKR